MCWILELIGKRRLVAASPYAAASMILAAAAAVRGLERSRAVVLIDGGGFKVEVLENLGGPSVLGRILVTRDVPGEGPGDPIVAYNAGLFLHLIPSDRILMATVERLEEVPRHLRRYVVRVQRLSGHTYLLRLGRQACLAEIRASGITPLRPRGYEARALSLLSRASVEYGPLTVRDAVDILSSELGVNRRRARSIIIGLARKKLVVVEKGQVLVEYSIS